MAGFRRKRTTRPAVAVCLFSLLVLLTLGCRTAGAIGERICIEKRPLVVDESALEKLKLIRDIQNALALPLEIAIIPCDTFGGTVAAFSRPEAMEGVPAGEYIIYNPTWLQQVAGTDRTQAVFLIGHELGHFVAGHFAPSNTKSRRRKELEADGYGACAVARLQGEWSALEGLLKRIRNDFDDNYPSTIESLTEARKQFNRCGGQVPPPPELGGGGKL